MEAVLNPEIPDEDRLRGDLYDFLAALLARPADGEMLRRAGDLTGDDSPLGRAIQALAQGARQCDPTMTEREYNALFIGVGRGELVPYASFYLTGFLNDKPLAQLRKDMGALHVTRAADVSEPEDGIASLFDIMGGLVAGRFGAPVPLDRQATFFNRHVAPWAGHFLSDLEAAESAVFYAGVGAVGQIFMEIEREAFRLSAGKPA